MKKFSISTQILLLVFTVLLCTSLVFVFISYYSLHKVAEDQIYKRLESYATIVSSEPNLDIKHERPQTFEDMGISVVVKKGNELDVNDPNNFLTSDELEELIDKVQEEATTNPFFRFSIKGEYHSASENEDIYYVYLTNPNDDYTLIFTDSTYISGFVRSVLLKSFSAFTAIIFIACAVIYGWSTRVTHRLKLIQNHLLNLQKEKYEQSYEDYGLDEIGELSRSVEEMRKEIGANEKTKQEMLQNLSHDFKTPISVIKSYAEAYQDGMAGNEALEVIINQADLLKHKVNRLLQYNSLEYLTKDKPFEEINMTHLVSDVVQNYKYQTTINFNLDLAEDIIFLGYNENWYTVVENIIDNAKRYAKTEIKIILRENRLRIYNDGEPIDEQFLNSIFKPYEKGSKGEFGLGMSIVKKTVDFFGMNMKVQNEDYGGVSFIIENRG